MCNSIGHGHGERGDAVAGEKEEPGPLAQKLRKLWETKIDPRTGRPYSFSQIARAICEKHNDPDAITGNYIGRLMNPDRRIEPSMTKLRMLADFFDVPLSHLVDAEQWSDEDLNLLLVARRSPAIRSIAFRASELSEESLAAFESILKHMEAADQQLRAQDDSSRGGRRAGR